MRLLVLQFMKHFTTYIYLAFCLLSSSLSFNQSNNSSTLHLQFYHEGICDPIEISTHYSNNIYQNTRTVFQSGGYYSTVFMLVRTKDTSDLNPQTHHQSKSSSIELNPLLDYDLIITNYKGFNRINADSMIVKIEKLKHDAQVVIPFKKGTFALKEMTHFKKIEKNSIPFFETRDKLGIKLKLKLDSTAFYKNGNVKSKVYLITKNFPLFYSQEFDSATSSLTAEGCLLLLQNNSNTNNAVWKDNLSNKYGYWNYYFNEAFYKHEVWAGYKFGEYEWYQNGQLKSEHSTSQYNKPTTKKYYLKNGLLKEEFVTSTNNRNNFLKEYFYSSKGKITMINTFKSLNGITREELVKRKLFYSTGALKTEENYENNYHIKHYNEDGTTKSF